jgi:plasmid stabilization system protein ParE
MRLEFHRLIVSDISSIMAYYEDVGGPKLAAEFYSELRSFFQKAAKNPEAYSIRERDLRRVNLETFPYHFLFRIVDDCVRVLVVRHHGRRPALGVDRR